MTHWQDFCATLSVETAAIEGETSALIQIPLTHWQLLWIEGTDADTFLQGQSTCDIRQLTENTALRGANCNQKGRVVFNFTAFKPEANRIGLLMPADMIDTAAKTLGKYMVFAKAEARREAEFGYLGLVGTELDQQLAQLGYSLTQEHSVNHLQGVSFYKIEGDRTLCFGPSETLIALSEKLNVPYCSERIWWLRENLAGIGHCRSNSSEEYLPQMWNMDLTNGVSFKKGCYLGQEVVARMHYKGTDKRRLQHAQVSAEKTPELGASLYSANGKAVGEIVQVATQVPTKGSDAIDLLAILALAAVDADEVFLQPDGTEKLRFQTLPYAIT